MIKLIEIKKVYLQFISITLLEKWNHKNFKIEKNL